MQRGFVFGVAITLLILLSVGGAYYLGTKSDKSKDQPKATAITETQVIPTQQIQNPQPTQEADRSDIPEGWLTYKNEEYGFEISYPASYEALTDEENLYGWPDAIVLFYNGGQSYDLPIEIWDSQAQYQTKYPNADNLTVKEVGGKYLTLMNVNFEDEVDEIIKTFKITK